jgi:hypothetical protein
MIAMSSSCPTGPRYKNMKMVCIPSRTSTAKHSSAREATICIGDEADDGIGVTAQFKISGESMKLHGVAGLQNFLSVSNSILLLKAPHVCVRAQ